MSLRSYLKQAGRTAAEFAREIECSTSFLSEIMADPPNSKQPGLALAVRIERATAGSIPVESWDRFKILQDRHAGHSDRVGAQDSCPETEYSAAVPENQGDCT